MPSIFPGLSWKSQSRSAIGVWTKKWGLICSFPRASPVPQICVVASVFVWVFTPAGKITEVAWTLVRPLHSRIQQVLTRRIWENARQHTSINSKQRNPHSSDDFKIKICCLGGILPSLTFRSSVFCQIFMTGLGIQLPPKYEWPLQRGFLDEEVGLRFIPCHSLVCCLAPFV